MNVMNTSGDELPECPLCMEPLEVDDLNFYPCTCGYQICRFCWHRIRTDENELCPACRKAYPENPADFTPLSQEQISALKAEKRQRDQQRKQKITENRKHLANVRVVQKNLVFVVGLPPRLADAEILKKHEYFGKYGKIHKVVINPSTAYAGVQGPSASAYVTYVHNNDALRAIQSVNNITIDGRSIKTSLGTTKYCSHFMKNQTCPKPDCMYLHELGDQEASFTKEEMHQGKHQEYEKRLHDSLIAQMAQQASQPSTVPSPNGGASSPSPVTVTDEMITSSSPTPGITNGEMIEVPQNGNGGTVPNQEAWPSLSTSPVTVKENKLNGKLNGNNNSKENIRNESNRKHDKLKADKTKGSKKSTQKDKHKLSQQQQQIISNLEDELGETDSDSLSQETDRKADTPSISTTDSGTVSESDSGKSSPGTFPDHPGTLQANANLITASASSSVMTATQEQLSKLNGIEQHMQNDHAKSIMFDNVHKQQQQNGISEPSEMTSLYTNNNNDKLGSLKTNSNLADTSARLSKLNLFDDNSSFFSRGGNFNSFLKLDGTSDHSQSMTNAQLPDLLNGTLHNNNLINETDQKQLIKNLGGFGSHNNGDNTNDDWEAAFKYLMKSNNMGSNNKSQYDQDHQQEEWLRLQEIRKHSALNSGLGMNQFNMFNGAENNPEYFHQNEISRLALYQYTQQQQQQQQRLNMHSDPHVQQHPNNMSKFFDFHKNQQQQQQSQQFMMNGHNTQQNPQTDQLNMANLLDSHHRMNPNFVEQSNGLLHMQKQRLMNNKFDGVSNNMVMHNNQQNRLHTNPAPYSNVEDDLGFDPFKETQKALAELINDEAVQQQQRIEANGGANMQNTHRARMPPPGFNHLQTTNYNNFGGAPSPRSQTGSKLLPFVNMPNTQLQQQQQQQANNWPLHMGQFQQPQNTAEANFSQQQQQQQQQQQHKTGYGNGCTDWNFSDPAIVSFRQFSQFGPQQQQQQQQQQNQPNNDLFMSQINQQQNMQNPQGFGHHNGMNMQQNSMQPQTSPAQVFSHSNGEQNIYMQNNLTNGFWNNFDKFISLPPGFNGKQKTECIN